MIKKLVYKLSEGSTDILNGCCAAQVIEEHSDAIKEALDTLSVVVDVDDDFGFVKIISVNGHEII